MDIFLLLLLFVSSLNLFQNTNVYFGDQYFEVVGACLVSRFKMKIRNIEAIAWTFAKGTQVEYVRCAETIAEIGRQLRLIRQRKGPAKIPADVLFFNRRSRDLTVCCEIGGYRAESQPGGQRVPVADIEQVIAVDRGLIHR